MTYYKKEKNKDVEEDDSNENPPGDLVEIEPIFIGGAKGMTDFIIDNVCYPEAAKEMGEQGIIYVQFFIEKDGRVTNALIRKGTSEILCKEAIRLIETMPNWKPGKQLGKPVRVNFTIPIQFRLG